MNKKILIVDDNQTFINLLTDGLPKQRYEIFSAGDGEAGLKKAEEVNPDLILLDLVMPKMGGIDFLRALREIDGLKDTPVLIVSQVSDFDRIADGMSLGVRGYIIKSDLTLDQIVSQIGAALSS